MLHDCQKHLHSVEESYWEHMYHALGFGFRMIWGGLGAILHAICPAVCQFTASRTVAGLHAQLQDRLARARKE